MKINVILDKAWKLLNIIWLAQKLTMNSDNRYNKN